MLNFTLNKNRFVSLIAFSLLSMAYPAQAASKGGALNFQNPSVSPVLFAGSQGQPTFITDPGVLKDGMGRYHLFITNQFCDMNGNGVFDETDGLFDPNRTMDACFNNSQAASTLYAFSSDQGKTWTVRPSAVLSANPKSQDWDREKIETPFPIQVGDRLYLFYCATGNHSLIGFKQNRYSIGVATLDLRGRSIQDALLRDGETFIKHPRNPILPYNATESAFGNAIPEPSVVWRDGKFELFVTAIRTPDPKAGIGEGDDMNVNGIAFLKVTLNDQLAIVKIEPSNILDFSNLLNFINSPAKDKPLNIVEVRYFGGRYHAFYTSFEDDNEFHKKEKIKYAVSSDGLNWENPRLILAGGSSSVPFDNWGIMAPSVIIKKKQVILFYSAWGISNGGCVREGSGARWGYQVDDQSKCLYGALGRAVFSQN